MIALRNSTGVCGRPRAAELAVCYPAFARQLTIISADLGRLMINIKTTIPRIQNSHIHPCATKSANHTGA